MALISKRFLVTPQFTWRDLLTNKVTVKG